MKAGDKFGRWTVERVLSQHPQRVWAKCECGRPGLLAVTKLRTTSQCSRCSVLSYQAKRRAARAVPTTEATQ